MEWRFTKPGYLEIEVLLSTVLLGILATTFVGALVYTQQSQVLAGQHARAAFLADEGVEAVRNIRDGAWNELAFSQSGVQTTSGFWEFIGEGTDETIGSYTRTITFTDICRDGSDEIVTCPGSYTDLLTKQVDVSVSWTSLLGVARSVTRTTILTNWDSSEWLQTDWSGGAGQAIWTAADEYDSDDGGIAITPSGQVQLLAAGSACSAITWPFTTSSNYTFDSGIEVTGGQAQLVAMSGVFSGFTTPALDSYEYETTQGEWPSFINVTGDIFAVAYEGPGGDGFIETYTISDAGAITTTPLDTLEFDTSSGTEPVLFQVSGSVYAVAYRGPGDDGFLKTFTIDGSGAISTVIDTLEFDTGTGREPDVVQIGSTDYFAIVYRGDGTDGYVATVQIDGAGSIGASVVDVAEFDAVNGEAPSILHVSGDVYAVAYQGDADDGYIATFDINSDGTITQDIVGELEFDTSNGETPSAVQVNGDVYAVAYEGAGSDGFVATVSIDSSGTVGASVIDVFEFNTTQALEPDIVAVTGDIYAIAYGGAGNDGFISTVEISSTGTITSSVIETVEYNTAQGLHPDLFSIDTDTYAVAYRGAGNDGFVTSFTIDGTGDITVVQTYEYNTSEGREPSVTSISGDVYAIAYRGPGADGFVSTVDIDSAGVITTSVIDTYEFDTSQAHRPNILPISGTVYAVAYQGSGDDGFLVTIDITAAGVITSSVIDSHEFQTNFADTPVLTEIASGYYAVTYEGAGADGFMETFAISPTGTITTPAIDVLEFDSGNGEFPEVLVIDADTFAVFYDGVDTDGFVRTLNIGSTGDIQSFIIDQFEFDTAFAYSPELFSLSGTVYAIAYEGDSDDGWLATLDIQPDGSIGSSLIDSFEYRTDFAQSPSVQSLSNDVYAIAYEGPDNDGFVSLITIGSSGTIASSLTDTFEFDTTEGLLPSMLLDGNNLVIAYEGSGNDGFITTIEMTTSSSYPTNSPSIQPSSTGSVTGLDQWSGFTEMATKNGGEIYYQLSDDSGATWYYWDGSAWTAAGATDYNTAAIVDTNIWEFPTASGDLMFRAFLESDGTQLVQLDQVEVTCATLQMEVGQVSVDENWTTVSFANTYTDPVVVASHQDINNTLPATTRVRNVTTTEFDIRLHNPGDANLSSDTVTYWVVESGVWELDNTPFEARKVEVSTVGSNGNGWTGDAQTYRQTFPFSPVVFHQVMTDTDTDWITSFVSSNGSNSSPPGNTDFAIGLNGAEVTDAHGTETIGWIALDQTTTSNWSTIRLEADQTTDSVVGFDNACTTFAFSTAFVSTPFAIVSLQEMDGNNGGWAVQCDGNLGFTGIYIDEDQENDTERSHTTEVAGWVAFSNAFSIAGGGGGGGSYPTTSTFTSSAFDAGETVAFQYLEWDEDLTGCTGCDVLVEVRAAPDSEGSPGTFTDWYGATGAGDTFTDPDGSLISTDLNGYQWLQYRVTLNGDGTTTPVIQEIRLDYR